MIWYTGQTVLFLVLLVKAAPAFLPTALFVALRPLFLFQQAQHVQVFPLKPAPFCKLFAGLGSTNTSATSLLFSYYLTLVLFSPPCPLPHLFSCLKLCGKSGRNFLLLQFYQATMGPLTLGNDAADKLTRRGALLAPSAIPCSLSPLIFRIYSCLFSNWRRTGHIGSLDFHRGACAPSSCSLCSLSSTLQRTQPSVRFLSL